LYCFALWLQLGSPICKLCKLNNCPQPTLSLYEIDQHGVVATTMAGDRDEALEWFSEKLRLMLTFEGDPADADYQLDEWPEGLLAHAANPTIPVFIVSAVAAHPQASRCGCGHVLLEDRGAGYRFSSA